MCPRTGWPAIQIFPPPWRRSFWPTCPGRSACSASRGRSTGSGCVGRAGYGRRLIGALSGGQRQRVLLARALISRPEVMLLDEPTSGMDLQSGENFYRLLAGLNRDHGLTILMVGHDVDRVCSYVSTLYCLEEGTLAELTPGQVRRERAGLHRHSDMTRERRGERSVHL